jgi:hypothetical protein
MMNSAEVALANAVGRLATAHERLANAAVVRNRAEANRTEVMERLANELGAIGDGLLAVAEAMAPAAEDAEAPSEEPPANPFGDVYGASEDHRAAAIDRL